MPYLVLGLLPLLGAPLAIIAARAAGRSQLAGLVTWGVAVAAITQLLSLANALTRVPALVAWVLFDVVAAVVIVRYRDRLSTTGWKPRSRAAAAVVLVLVAVFGLELLVDVLSPPTTWDSMTYHMARVAHWLQNRDVWHYPTSIDRQLWMGPWNEWVIAQVQVLAGSDALANLVQWLDGIIAAGLVWALTLALGASRRAALLAVAAFVTIPSAVTQGTNTASDLATTMWVLAFVGAAERDARRPSAAGALLCGLTLGLACLSKGSAFVFTAPFLALWVYRRARLSLRAAAPAIGGAALAATAIVGPFLAYNYSTWHDALGPPQSVALTNSSDRSPAADFSTLVRTTATTLTTPSTAANNLIARVAKAMVRGVGQDPNADATTFAGNTFDVVFQRDEDYASAPMHLALLAGALFIVAAGARRREGRRLLAHAAAWTSAALLFVSLLKWSVWNNRIELPLLAVGMPMVGMLLDRVWRWVPVVVVPALAISAVAWLAVDDARPLVTTGKSPSIVGQSRRALYFEKRPDLRLPYSQAVAAIAATHARSVGLVLRVDDWEYPFFALSPHHGARIRFFDARSQDWANPARMPHADLIVCTDLSAPECQAGSGWRLAVDGRIRVLARR